MVLAAVFVDGEPDGLERRDVHQQVVYYYADISHTGSDGLGQHHSVHAPEWVVRGEEVAAGGIQTVQIVSRVAYSHVSEAGANEFHWRLVAELRDDVVHLLFVDQFPQPFDQHVRDEWIYFGDFGGQNLVDVDGLHEKIVYLNKDTK